jgi:transposase
MARSKTTKPTPAPAPEAPRENRYLRSARVIIETGDGVTAEELALKAEMSTATAGHCLEAFKGVCQALRDAKLLPAKKTPAKAPEAPEPAVAK